MVRMLQMKLSVSFFMFYIKIVLTQTSNLLYSDFHLTDTKGLFFPSAQILSSGWWLQMQNYKLKMHKHRLDF